MPEWKKIPKFNYEISDDGRVKFLGGWQKFGNQTQFIPEREVKTFPNKERGNYICVNLSRKKFRVHRLVAEAFVPNPDNLPHINHKDGDKSNNRKENLEWTTILENNQHSHEVLKNNPGGKFNEDIVKQIRETTGSSSELAKLFGCNRQTINHIKTRKTWRHL